MCQCSQQQYCVGCGKWRVLIARLMVCGECYDDWLALTPVRYRDPELTPEEEHARGPAA